MPKLTRALLRRVPGKWASYVVTGIAFYDLLEASISDRRRIDAFFKTLTDSSQDQKLTRGDIIRAIDKLKLPKK